MTNYGGSSMRKLNPAHIEKILELVNNAPYFQLLSMEVCEIREGYTRVEVDLNKKHLTPFATVHGGVYASLLDTACYWACYGELDEDAGYVTLDVNSTMLGSSNSGRLIIEGRRIKIGKSVCMSQATMVNEAGKLIAHGESKMMVTHGMQTITSAVEAMGSEPLPKKFI
jgi:uncharacterized protein (TIGR00369 family)